MKAEITEDHKDAYHDLVEMMDMMGVFEHEKDFDPALMRPSNAVELLDELFRPTQPKGASK